MSDPRPLSPADLAQARRKAQRLRRQRAVGYFVDAGYPLEQAIRLAALYAAAVAHGQRAGRKSTAETRSEVAAEASAGHVDERMKEYEMWLPKGMLPHERVAARIARLGHVSSETAHRIASQVARSRDAKKESA